jgi:CRP-like cAMP-binding protein
VIDRLGQAAHNVRDDMELDERLSAVWLTQGLSAAALHGLGRLARPRRLAAGDVLMREGEATASMSVVLAGRIALRMRVPERGLVTITTIEPGDVVGWSAVVPPFRATSTAIALSDTELAELDGGALRAALDADADLAHEVYPVLLRAVARRLEGARLQLLDLFSQRWVEPW